MKTAWKRVGFAAALLCALSGSASAQRLHGRVIIGPRAYAYAPFYDPFFWGYYSPYMGDPYIGARSYGDVRTQVTPKDAQVYIDGFYAGTASDFDGVFKRLHLTPGGHALTLYLPGYRTVTKNIYVRPDSTFKLDDSMERLANGETSDPPPVPATPPRNATPGRRG
jgi:hypothetical protein